MHVPLARSMCAALALSGVVFALASQKTGRSSVHRREPSSVQQTMLLLVDPAADALWSSVGTSTTVHGTRVRVHEPRTAADWAKVTAYAQTLVSGARRLQTAGLPVGANSHSRLADADTPGTRTAVQIRADIDDCLLLG